MYKSTLWSECDYGWLTLEFDQSSDYFYMENVPTWSLSQLQLKWAHIILDNDNTKKHNIIFSLIPLSHS